MIISRSYFALAVAVLLAVSAWLAWKICENTHLRSEAAEQAAISAARTAELRQQVTVASQRVTAAEAKVTGLLKAVKEAETARASARAAAPVVTDTQELIRAAQARATQLIREGKLAEALEEYVKCYREVEPKRPGSSECQSLMSAIARLGRNYPPAVVALGELRDAAMRQHEAKPANRDFVFEIALLNERLGEGRRTIALYDSLPPNDLGRQSLSMIANASFIEARLYADALVGNPVGKMLALLESGTRLLSTQPPEREAELRKTVVDGSVKNIEVLTGAGKMDDARMLTEKLLAFDGSESTRAAIREHVERAGQPPAKE